MAVTIGLEWIGHGYEKQPNLHQKRFSTGLMRVDEMGKWLGAKSRKPWVRNLVSNEFINPQITFKNSTKDMNRGTMLYFHLFEGNTYEVCYWDDWKNKIRYKCEILNNRICRKDI